MKEERKSSSIISEKMIYIARSMVGIYQTTLDRVSITMIHYTLWMSIKREQPYLEWSKTFVNCDCVTNPPRTQGIIELHEKIMKHITLSTKKTKSRFSYCWLKVEEDIFPSTLENQFVQNRKKVKLATENYGKSKKMEM